MATTNINSSISHKHFLCGSCSSVLIPFLSTIQDDFEERIKRLRCQTICNQSEWHEFRTGQIKWLNAKIEDITNLTQKTLNNNEIKLDQINDGVISTQLNNACSDLAYMYCVN